MWKLWQCNTVADDHDTDQHTTGYRETHEHASLAIKKNKYYFSEWIPEYNN